MHEPATAPASESEDSDSPTPQEFKPETLWSAAMKRLEHTERLVLATVTLFFGLAFFMVREPPTTSERYWTIAVVMIFFGFAHLHLINLLLGAGELIIAIETEHRKSVDCFRRLTRIVGRGGRMMPFWSVGFASIAFGPSAVPPLFGFSFAPASSSHILAYSVWAVYSLVVLVIWGQMLKILLSIEKSCKTH